MILQDLRKGGHICPPSFLIDNTHYLCTMGSHAYGIGSENSDIDIYGFCIPPKRIVFPHTVGVIQGFGNQGERFEQWQEHHIKDEFNDYDITVYNIVKFFKLCMDNNPNMIDSLFVPENCMRHMTQVGKMVRDNRLKFLHKGSYHKFSGYAYSQKNKMMNRDVEKLKLKNEDELTPREKSVLKYGYDTKFAYHTVRLLNESEQILTTKDLDLARDKELLKYIKDGGWSYDKICEYFDKKEKYLQNLYETSSLQHKPDEKEIKQLLMNCLEHHYGKLDNIIKIETKDDSNLLKDLIELVEKYK